MLTSKLLAVATAAVMCTSAFALTDAEHKAENDRIAAQYKSAKEQCKGMKGNAKDVCEKEAKGQEKIAKAELALRKDPSEKNQHDLAKVKADTAYDVAKEKCDDLKGNAEDVCQKEAKAEHVKALEAAKLNKTKAGTY